MTADHAVDGAPVGQTSYVAVVDEVVDAVQLATEMGVIVGGLLRIVAIYSIKLYSTLATPVDGIIEQLPLPHRPQYELVAVVDEHFQRVDSERPLLANLWVAMLDDCSVEVDCNSCHESCLFLDGVVVFLTIVALSVITIRAMLPYP